MNADRHFEPVPVVRDGRFSFDPSFAAQSDTAESCAQLLARDDQLGRPDLGSACCDVVGHAVPACITWGPPCPSEAPV